MQLLAAAPVNTGRQLALDLARGLAVLFMILVHVQEMFALPAVAESWLGTAVEFLGGPPAAPVFMFLLGTGIVYSRRATELLLLKRGVLILLAGYLLNLLRSTLPLLLQGKLEQDGEYYTEAVTSFFEIDILQFAGLALIAFALLRACRRGWTALLGDTPRAAVADAATVAAFAAVCALPNMFIGRIPVDGLLPQALTGLLWGSSEHSYFPFLTWFAYPAAGYLFGLLLIRCQRPDMFYGMLLCLAAAALLQFVLTDIPAILLPQTGDDYDYYHHNAVMNVAYTLFVLCWLALLYFVARLPLAFTTLRRWSANVAEIYFIHWVLLGWMGVVLDYENRGYVACLLIFLLVAVTSDALAWLYRRLTAPAAAH